MGVAYVSTAGGGWGRDGSSGGRARGLARGGGSTARAAVVAWMSR